MKRLTNLNNEIITATMPYGVSNGDFVHEAPILMMDPTVWLSSYEINANIDLVSIEPDGDSGSVVVFYFIDGKSVKVYSLNTDDQKVLQSFLYDIYESLESKGFRNDEYHIKYKLLKKNGAPVKVTVIADQVAFEEITTGELLTWDEVYLYIEDKGNIRTSLEEKVMIPFETFNEYKDELLMDVKDMILFYSASNAIFNYNSKLEKLNG